MQKKHIVAVGAHPGDMEISCGAVLAAHRAKGNKVTIVHLTNSPKFSSLVANKLYFHQLRAEAEDAAATINAHAISDIIEKEDFCYSRENVNLIVNLFRKLQPTCVITHWKKSRVQDHILTHQLVTGALTELSATNNLNGQWGLFFSEHIEDKIDFEPLIYVDVSEYMNTWFKMVSCYEDFKRSNGNYIQPIEYYRALAKIRGRENYFSYACVFNSYRNKIQSKDILP